jgi:hypothetical protein
VAAQAPLTNVLTLPPSIFASSISSIFLILILF